MDETPIPAAAMRAYISANGGVLDPGTQATIYNHIVTRTGTNPAFVLEDRTSSPPCVYILLDAVDDLQLLQTIYGIVRSKRAALDTPAHGRS